MLVYLNEEKYKEAIDCAIKINNQKQKDKAVTKKVDYRRTDLEIQIEGTLCERAVYDFLDVPWACPIFKGRGDNIDLVYKGKRCSIKKMGRDIFYIPLWQLKKPCDYYIGVDVIENKPDQYCLAGYISKQDFDINCREYLLINKVLGVPREMLKKFKPKVLT